MKWACALIVPFLVGLSNDNFGAFKAGAHEGLTASGSYEDCRTDIQGTGELTLRARPKAEIVIGDTHYGLTPIEKVRLPAGCHTVKLTYGKGALRTTETLRLKVSPGDSNPFLLHLPFDQNKKNSCGGMPNVNGSVSITTKP